MTASVPVHRLDPDLHYLVSQTSRRGGGIDARLGPRAFKITMDEGTQSVVCEVVKGGRTVDAYQITAADLARAVVTVAAMHRGARVSL